MSEIIQFQPQGVCTRFMQVKISDDVVEEVEFLGGCSGNLQGISKLVKGMRINDVIKRLKGIKCNGKPTSCPDQFAKCLIEYQNTITLEL